MITTDSIREIQDKGYCVLSAHLPLRVIDDCRDSFWPVLLAHLKAHGHEPNRGSHRHFLPMRHRATRRSSFLTLTY
ncbi:MAG: hypothetical protein DMG57_05500 [Acidobacteria bacterium]|nr:MAG: hypothetical protein DMG57_05500 [Acidobacteriota bacterium]